MWKSIELFYFHPNIEWSLNNFIDRNCFITSRSAQFFPLLIKSLFLISSQVGSVLLLRHVLSCRGEASQSVAFLFFSNPWERYCSCFLIPSSGFKVIQLFLDWLLLNLGCYLTHSWEGTRVVFINFLRIFFWKFLFTEI